MPSGFVPFSRASFMLDFVSCAMLFIVPVLCWSIWLVRVRGRHALHRKVQIGLGSVLLVTVVLFEIDIRLNGWRHLAEPSPFYDSWLFPVLYVHLFFAVSTPLLWIWTIGWSIRHYDPRTRFGDRAATHRRLARLAAADMIATACTGWIFYAMAFVAGG